MLLGFYYELSAHMRELRFRLLISSAFFDVVDNLPKIVADFSGMFGESPTVYALERYAREVTEEGLMVLDRYITDTYFSRGQ
jgi:hypothetical protein